MVGNVLLGVRMRLWTALCLGLLTCIAAPIASAADCPGHPDALGTSRTLVIDPKAHPRIGAMNYTETLPLRDHEVVLTFDDGPLPHNSDQILEILASQCVKATFFTVGRMAQSFPEGVRKVRDAGHSVGTHTQNHPTGFDKFSIERARQEIDDGIASVTAALGDGGGLTPFFRPPGLRRSPAVEDYLASKGIQLWSADFPADDWRHVSPSRVYELAIKRLEAKRKGILLLHDIQARTVVELPRILHEMKARGYRIVHVVPATSQQPNTPTEPPQWQLHPPSETVAISHWPRIPKFVFADAGPLPRCRIRGGMTDSCYGLRSRSIAPDGVRAEFRCRRKRHGPGCRRTSSGVLRLSCQYRRRAFSNSRKSRARLCQPSLHPHIMRNKRSQPDLKPTASNG